MTQRNQQQSSEPTERECEYVQCRYVPDEELAGPDGFYEFCTYHARRMVEYSPNFDWRKGETA